MTPFKKARSMAESEFSDDERLAGGVDAGPKSGRSLLLLGPNDRGVLQAFLSVTAGSFRGNVRFHATCQDAEAAGFRACKRCKPTAESLPERHAASVTQACRIIEESEEVPSLDELAAAVGLSRYRLPSHFQRPDRPSLPGATQQPSGTNGFETN